jgi:SAM-dependent methyltransferase
MRDAGRWSVTSVIVQTASLKRYHQIFRRSKNKSILRCLEYERLSTIRLTGHVLDFGGGGKANYSDEIAGWGDPDQGYVYESANIDPKANPTYLLEKNGTIPVEPESYDAVISLNTFEHVYGLSAAFTEIRRVLKPGGQLMFIVPFIFRVHAHPDDYFRGTPSFWNKFLDAEGFGDVETEAMNWGPFSTAAMMSGLPGPFKVLRRKAALLLDIAYCAVRYGQGVTLRLPQDSPICQAPIGYFIRAVKRGRSRNVT